MGNALIGISLVCMTLLFLVLGGSSFIIYETAETVMQQMAALIMLVSACVLWVGVVVSLTVIRTRK